MLASDLRAESRWLSCGFLLMFSSGFGQTYYIALFSGQLTAELGLSDGQFGGLYTIATLASASLLVWAGRLADRLPIRRLGVGIVAGLALAALGMAAVTTAPLLALAIFGLRFFGQGMLTHLGMTAMGRWFSAKRGRAVSIAALGLPAAEAVLPFAAVASVGVVGWRATWAVTAGALVLVMAPVLAALLARERRPQAGAGAGDAGAGEADAAEAGEATETGEAAEVAAAEAGEREAHGAAGRGRDWTRGEVLRSPLFYALLPGVLAHPMVVTGVFFNQVGVVELKGWELSWWAASFPMLSAAHVLAALGAGWLVDRFGARRLLPAVIVPLAAGTLLLNFAADARWLPVFMALTGLTQGGLATVQGALWPELFGVLHLGAIRAVVVAAVVLSTALAPGVMGALLDAGVGLDAQVLGLALYCVAAAAWTALLVPRLGRLSAA